MPLREDILKPIPGDNPSGENLRYAPIYDQIKEARREEDDVPQGEWQQEVKKADSVLVIKLAGDTLATKSKDLQIAAWLTEAMLRREGFAGLQAGLSLLRGLLTNFWDTLYPELEDGDAELRAAPLDWVGSRLDQPIRRVALTRGGLDWFKYKESRAVPTEEDAAANEARQQARATAIEEGKLPPETFDADFDATPTASYENWDAQLAACLEATGALKAAVAEKFTDYIPSFSDLEKTLEEVKNTVRILLARKRSNEPAAEAPAEEAVSAEAPAEEAGYAPPAAAPARKAAPRRAAGPEPADRDDAIERVAALARYLREQDAGNPAPYLMLRGLRWGELRAAGEGYDPDSSLLEAPPTGIRQTLKRLANDGEWQQVLETAETALGTPCGRAWLDLQRYAATACDNLGYYAAAWAIKSAVRALLADFPRLVEMSLSDDTPTANAETRAWLKEFSAPAEPDLSYSRPPASEASAEEGVGTEAGPDAYQLAIEAARSGQVREAIEILNREMAQEPSGRGRFQRRVQLAQVCLGAGEAAIALPILEELAAEIERRSLEAWEPPDVIAHVLSLLYRSMDKTETKPEEKQKVYGRICRLDPVEALALRR
jgi:type VI secretion system protein ImpA